VRSDDRHNRLLASWDESLLGSWMAGYGGCDLCPRSSVGEIDWWFGDVRCDDRLETACWQRGMSPFMRSCKAGYGGINLCPRRRATCYLLQGVVRRAPLLSASRVLVRADHSGELQRGRRECFDEQVIDIRGDDLRGGAFGLSFGRVARMTHVVCHRDRMLSALGSYMYRSRDVPDLTRRMPHVSRISFARLAYPLSFSFLLGESFVGVA